MELRKKINIELEHKQCHSCKWWECAKELGSFCSNVTVAKTNTDGKCGGYAKIMDAEETEKANPHQVDAVVMCPDCNSVAEHISGYAWKCKQCDMAFKDFFVGKAMKVLRKDG